MECITKYFFTLGGVKRHQGFFKSLGWLNRHLHHFFVLFGPFLLWSGMS